MPAGVITALEVQKRNKQRINVYLDEVFAFSLPLDEAVRLHKGQALSEADVEALQAQASVQYAVDSAARYLSYRPRSVQEVRHNLTKKGIPQSVIAPALERLEALGYLDDHAFAAFWVRERNAHKPLSQRALRYELRQKGIADTIIDDVLADTDADEAAYQAATSQVRRLRGRSRREFRDRLLAFLQRRGFSFRESGEAIRKLEETMGAEDGYFADEANNLHDLILHNPDE